MEEVRAQLSEFPSSPDLWQPSDGRSREEWMQCHGQPADVCRRTREKLHALKKLISSNAELQHQLPQIASAARSNQSVIILYWFTRRIVRK